MIGFSAIAEHSSGEEHIRDADIRRRWCIPCIAGVGAEGDEQGKRKTNYAEWLEQVRRVAHAGPGWRAQSGLHPHHMVISMQADRLSRGHALSMKPTLENSSIARTQLRLLL